MNAALEALMAKAARPALLADEIAEASAETLSRQGGAFLAMSGEGCPEDQGVALIPILSIHTPELPFVPQFLGSHSYWAFFIRPDAHEQHIGDGSLVVRRYGDVGELEPLVECGSTPVGLAFRQVVDYPSASALGHVLSTNPDLLGALQLHADEVRDRFPCHSGLKLGGYPHLMQDTAFLQTLEPDFQLQFDSCDAYSYADSGMGYVYANLSAVIWESA